MSVQIQGFKELERKLKQLPDRVQRKVMRSAINAAGTPILSAARSNADASKESGLLKKSLGKKVSTNKKAQGVTCTIGPKKNVSGEYKGKLRKPSRYAHLVEKAHVNAAGEYVPGKPFLGPAMDENQGQALSILQQKLGDGIAKEAQE